MVSELDSQTSFGSISTVQAPKKMQLKDFSAFFFFRNILCKNFMK